MRLILGSASPARLATLRRAGLTPVVRTSGVDEAALAAALPEATAPALVTALATAKAEAVAADVGPQFPDAVVIGCDSMLRIGAELIGKPGHPELARQCWQRIAGRTGELLTGHAVIRLRGGAAAGSASAVECTVVRFATPSDREIDAYIATGEPLAVAGGFTLDGLGGWFVDGIEGDPSNVLGISLPLTRRLLAEVGVGVTDLWSVTDGGTQCETVARS